MVRTCCAIKVTACILIVGFSYNYLLADFAPAYLGHVWAPPIATREMEQVEVAKVTLPGTPTKSEVEKVTQPGHVWPVATPTETDREKVSVKSSDVEPSRNSSSEFQEFRDFSLHRCPKPSLQSNSGSRTRSISDTVVVTLPKPHWHHVVATHGDDHPTNAIRTEKIWEGGLTFLMTWALEVGCGPESDCLVLDIGMNIGWYTALAASFQKNVVAFEPNPAPLEFGKKTVDLNGWSSHVRIVNAGLSQDKAPFYVDATLSKSGTRSANRKADAKSVKVPSHRLDDLIDPGAEICFLKADCQGCEGDAFLSGSQLLGAGNIKVVMLEFDHTDRARHALSTLQTLSPRPFHCLLIPVGLSFQGEQINDPSSASVQDLWDAVVAGVLEDCSAKKIDELAPRKIPPGYYTDLWLVRADVLAKLRKSAGFVAAEARRKERVAQLWGIAICFAFLFAACVQPSWRVTPGQAARRSFDGQRQCSNFVVGPKLAAKPKAIGRKGAMRSD
ncbi:unnamed protein product [Effrenium voratum]|nr:unnamed protein product [Effrenium voratum]